MSRLWSSLQEIGPGAMVAAAFIGPGTVTTASLSGSSFGYALLWAVLFSTVATCVLQEMAARLGVTTGAGVAEALRAKLRPGFRRLAAIALVVSALFVGNAAYEAGNITGVSMGLRLALPIDGGVPAAAPLLVGALAAGILARGRYALIERTLVLLVALMGLAFLSSALLTRPDPVALLEGLVLPTLPPRSELFVLSLVGTTIVPYNLFLHASSAATKWKGPEHLGTARLDTCLSVTLGGLITAAILVAAAAAGGGDLDRARLVDGLRPLLGDRAAFFTGLGFLAAGLSSAITAPLAAAYATTGILGWRMNLKEVRFRLVWAVVLLTGVVFAAVPSAKPTAVILFAQATNGLLLPLMAGFLLWVMNDRALLGPRRNGTAANLLGALVVLLTAALGVRALGLAAGWW